MTVPRENDPSTLPPDVARMAQLVAEATAMAVEEHRRLGYPVATLRDGEVVWIPAEEIPPYTPSPTPSHEAG